MAKAKTHGGKREGAGRPVNPEGRTVTIAVSVPGALVERLDAYTTEQGCSRSEAVTQAIRGLLKVRR